MPGPLRARHRRDQLPGHRRGARPPAATPAWSAWRAGRPPIRTTRSSASVGLSAMCRGRRVPLTAARRCPPNRPGSGPGRGPEPFQRADVAVRSWNSLHDSDLRGGRRGPRAGTHRIVSPTMKMFVSELSVVVSKSSMRVVGLGRLAWWWCRGIRVRVVAGPAVKCDRNVYLRGKAYERSLHGAT